LPARLRPLLSPRAPGVLDVLRLMGPRVFGLAVVQINFHVNIILANTMVAGSVGAIRYAFMLTFFALGIIAQSQGSAVFPSLAALQAEGDYDGFKDRLSRAMRNVLCLSFPASALLIVLGEPMVSVLQRGEWTSDSTSAVAWALGFYAIGIAGFALLEVLSRAFYALEDSRTPAIAGALAMFSNIILNLVFIQIVGDPENLARGAFAGLALANALTTVVEALALWWLIRRRLAGHGSLLGIHDREIIVSAAGSLLLSLLMAGALWLLTQALPTGGFTLALSGCALAGLIFFGGGYLFNISEIRELLRPFLRRVMPIQR
jgi:putative peptidoglycan lipid II flippase